MTIDDLLAEARSGFERITPERAHRETSHGSLIVDIRPAWQRASEVPGSVIIERNHLEWRLDPASPARIDTAVNTQRWIVLCQEGYASSLAAASLHRLGVDATDVIGGMAAWLDAGLAVVKGPTGVGRFVGDVVGDQPLAPLH